MLHADVYNGSRQREGGRQEEVTQGKALRLGEKWAGPHLPAGLLTFSDANETWVCLIIKGKEQDQEDIKVQPAGNDSNR